MLNNDCLWVFDEVQLMEAGAGDDGPSRCICKKTVVAVEDVEVSLDVCDLGCFI